MRAEYRQGRVELAALVLGNLEVPRVARAFQSGIVLRWLAAHLRLKAIECSDAEQGSQLEHIIGVQGNRTRSWLVKYV